MRPPAARGVALALLALLCASAAHATAATTASFPRLEGGAGRAREWRRFASVRSSFRESVSDDDDGLTIDDLQGSEPEKRRGAASPGASPETVGDGDVDTATPPYNPAWPSPATVAFAARAGKVGSLSLASSLPPEYDAAVGGRGVAPKAAAAKQTVFAAARHRAEKEEAEKRKGPAPEDILAAEIERPRPRKETILTAGYRLAEANAHGAKPDDVPVVAPLALGPAPAAFASAAAASRAASTSAAKPFSLAFAAGAAVDQPTRRFRPPDQALCVGNGVVLTANNLVIRTFDASTGTPLQGPVAAPDFLGLTGNFSDPVCIFDEPDTGRFFYSIFRFAEGSPGKYSHWVVAVSKTGNPADGFHGPYVFRNDGLDKESKPLPGLEDCAGGGPTRDGLRTVSPGCLGDYPSVGLDTHALVATFNLFVTEPGEKYAGVLAMTISKKDLLKGDKAEPAYATYSNWNAELAYTVQPAQTQAGTKHDAGRGGTVHLISTGPVTQNEPNVPTLAAWAITNTSAMAAPDFPRGGSPVVSKVALVETPAYRDPGAFKAERLAMPQPSPGVPLDTGDARTLQHVASGGVNWVATQTAMHVGAATSPLVVGVAYWALVPGWAPDGAYAPRLAAAGYAGLSGGRHLARPAITATRGGRAFIAAFMTGPDVAPSPVFVEADLVDGPKIGHVPAISPSSLGPGTPDKKWKGTNGLGTLRAGDYSAACLDAAGAPWLATMWAGGVPSADCVAKFGESKCPTWSSFVGKASLDPPADTRSAAERVAASPFRAAGTAGPAVPGARAGEWAAKAAVARAAAVAAAAPAPGGPYDYDPDDVPEAAVAPEGGPDDGGAARAAARARAERAAQRAAAVAAAAPAASK